MKEETQDIGLQTGIKAMGYKTKNSKYKQCKVVVGGRQKPGHLANQGKEFRLRAMIDMKDFFRGQIRFSE